MCASLGFVLWVWVGVPAHDHVPQMHTVPIFCEVVGGVTSVKTSNQADSALRHHHDNCVHYRALRIRVFDVSESYGPPCRARRLD